MKLTLVMAEISELRLKAGKRINVNNGWSLIISRLLPDLLGSSNSSTVGMLVWPPRLWAGTAALKIESYLDVH